MLKHANRFPITAGALLIAGVLWAVNGCNRQPSTERGTQVVKLSTMENTSDTLADLKAQDPFRAEVLAVIVRESTNLFAECGITNATRLVTNIYSVQFRDPRGQFRAVGGENATSDELILIKRMEKGGVYTFPDAFLR